MFYNEYCNCSQCIKYFKKEKPKMTREEALNKLKTIKTPLSVENIVDILEEVGVLEFEEEKEVNKLFSINEEGLGWDGPSKDAHLGQIAHKYGVVCLEEWSEGLVLWVGGQIVWKSWEKTAKIGDYVDIDWYDYPATNKVYTGQIRKIK